MSTYDIVLKKINPITIASVRGVIPTYPEQGSLWNILGNYLKQKRVASNGICFTLYHSEEPDIDAEVCEQINETIPSEGKVQSYLLPGLETAACTVHHGPFVTIGQAYEALIKWIEANGYTICGPSREVYLRPCSNGSQTDPDTVTEIQFPITKV